MTSENIYPSDLIDELRALAPSWDSTKTFPSKKCKQAAEIISKYCVESLASFSNLEKVYLVTHNLPNLGFCKWCGGNRSTCQNRSNTPYCGTLCYKADPDAITKISKIKTALYADPDWKQTTQNKAEATCMKNHGVSSPMKSRALHQKQQNRLGVAKRHKGFTCRGFEPQFIDWVDGMGFLDRIQMSTTSFRYFDYVKNCLRTYHPDFLIKNVNVYVEVKSRYTMSSQCSTSYEIVPKIESVRSAGYEIVVVVVDHIKREIALPPEYNTLDTNRLIELLAQV